MPRDDDKPRRSIMGDDARAEIGRGHRARTRTPAEGVVSGEISTSALDSVDTLDDVDPADLTPVGQVAARYAPELGALLVDMERRLAYRVQQVTARAPLGENDRERIEGEVAGLRKRQHDIEKQAADALKATAMHSVDDRAAFKRIDEKFGDVDKRHEKSEKGRTGLIASAVGSAGFALIALLTAAKADGASENTISTLVEKVRDQDREIDQLRALVTQLLVRNPFMPGFPALGDPP